MKNKKGFISMTLVYSFLTLFLFIMAAIMLSMTEKTNYISYVNNKVNEDIANFKGKSTSIMKRMLEDNSVVDGTMFSIGQIANNSIGNGNGLYYIDGGTGENLIGDENNDTVSSRIYFYRGQVENNNVIISKVTASETKNYCFKIIRTNEDGNIRMMYMGETSSNRCISVSNSLASSFDKYDLDNAFVGYMHGKAEKLLTAAPEEITDGYIFLNRLNKYPPTIDPSVEEPDSYKHTRYQDTHNYYLHDLDIGDVGGVQQPKYFYKNGYTLEYNDRNSEAKLAVDNWFVNNFGTISSIFGDSIFCTDRSVTDETTEGYSDIETIYVKSTNSFLCPNEQDRLNLSIYNGGGNSAINSLTYPVGLPTKSDIVFAGGSTYESNSNFYLNTGNSYWTLTPHSFTTADQAKVVCVNSEGKITSCKVTSSLSLYPVVSIKPDTVVKSGKGTKNEPYLIEVSSQ